MFNVTQLRETIIRPALKDLLMYSEEAEELLIFTCANESVGGTYLKQVKGPALGIYQMEPETYNDIWQNYIINKSNLLLILSSNFNAGHMPDEYRLVYDLRFATVMTRLHYARVKEPLPPSNNIDAIWNYYKTYYNSSYGAAEKVITVANYYRFLRN